MSFLFKNLRLLDPNWKEARGGYEAGVAGAGTDECGQLLVDAAVKLLRETYSSLGYPGKR